ncbi:CBU_0592 family membrane protein [Neptuniibacter sp. QD72_48]|uniref:CBU_0592 family membrane protein n=1 Tax=Neptuniibacter sp. QD72_48 TaxID=3398214 RepID=UPI0039F63A8A
MVSVTLGWLGTILYLLAHAWLSLLKNKASYHYYLANLVAAILVATSSYLIASWQAVVINVFWALVSFAAMKSYVLPRLPFSNAQLYGLLGVMFLAGAGGLLFAYAQQGMAILAWSSSIAYCLGYWRFSAGRLSQQSYYLVNTYAAVMLLPQLYTDANWPVLVLQIVWASVSLWGWYKGREGYVLSP